MKLFIKIAFLLPFLQSLSMQALEHGSTIILKQQNAEKYLSVGTPFTEGTSKPNANICVNSLVEEAVPKATSRWTVRKVGFGKDGVSNKVSIGDKILLENTATGFYLQNKNNTTVLKSDNTLVSSTLPNWEDPDNIITWDSSSESSIRLFSPQVTYQIMGVLPSAAAQSFNAQSLQALLNEQRGCSLMADGLKSVTSQVTKDQNGKYSYTEFGLALSSPTILKIEKGKPIFVQNRFPLPSTNSRYLNGLIMPSIASFDFDKQGNIIVSNAGYFPSSTEPFMCFAPLKHKVSDLLLTPGVPQKIYPYINDQQIIAAAMEKEAPWSFLRALNPIKYAKTVTADQINGLAQDGSTKNFDAASFFATYSQDFIQGAKSSLRIQTPKIGNGKVVGRQIFATQNSPLIVIDNVDTSDNPRIFTPRDDKGQLVNVFDYDVDDKGIIWVLSDQSEIFCYKNGEDNANNKGTRVVIKSSGADGIATIPGKSIFDKADGSVFDRALKMSVASGGPNEPDNITVALVSAAGQLAFGTGGTYDTIQVNNMSSLNDLATTLTGVTNANVSTDGKLAFVNFTNETRNSSNNFKFSTWRKVITPTEQSTAIDRLLAKFAKVQAIESQIESNFVPAIPKPQLTPDQVLKAGYASAEQKGFALTRFDFDGQDKDPEWPNQWTHRQFKIAATSKPTPDGRDKYFKLNLDGAVIFIQTSRIGQRKATGGNFPGEDQSLIEGWPDVDIIRANQGGPILMGKEISSGVDGAVAVIGNSQYKGVWLCLSAIAGQAPFSTQIGFANEELAKVACGSKDQIWVLKADGSVHKCTNVQTKAWTPVANVKAKSIAGGADGSLWFVDDAGSVKLMDPAGNIFAVPGGDATPVKTNPYSDAANQQMINPRAKFEKISAAGTANDFRLVAITDDKRLFSCDQVKPLTDEQIFNVSEAAVAISGLCALIFPIDPTNTFQKIWGGRTYLGWISGTNPSTDRPYTPNTWPYGSRLNNFVVPVPTTTSISKIPEFLKTNDLKPSYKQAIDKGFSAIGNAGIIGPDQDQMDAEGASDKSLHVNTTISLVVGLQNMGMDRNFAVKLYKCNGLNSGGNGHELCLDPVDHSIITSWPCFGSGMRDVSAGVDGTVCVLWGNTKIASRIINAGQVVRTDLGCPSDNGFLKLSVANNANIWGLTPDLQVYKYSGNGTSWNKIDGIKASSISAATDGGLWFIDGSTTGVGNLMFRAPNGQVIEMPGGKGKGLVRINATGSQTNFKLVAIDKDGNLFSADQANALTAEGISNVTEATVAANGLCALIFVPNSESTHQCTFKGGLTFVGWTQFAAKPATWGYPIPYREYTKKELSDYASMIPQYDAIEGKDPNNPNRPDPKGFAPAGSRSWVVWTHRGFTDDPPIRTIHSQHKVALISGPNGSGQIVPPKMFKLHTGAGFVGKGIVQLTLNPNNQSIITGWRGTNKGDEKIREITLDVDGTLAAITLDARYVKVWSDPAHNLIENDPIMDNIPCNNFYAVKIACGGFVTMNNKRTILLWVLGIDANGRKSIYRYNGNPDPNLCWTDLGLEARAIGCASSRLFWIDKDGSSIWFVNELTSNDSGILAFRNVNNTGLTKFKDSQDKDLKKLCVSGLDNTGNYAIVAIGGPNNQLYSAHTNSDGLRQEGNVNNVCEAAVAANGLCAVVFRINRFHPFEASGGAPAYIGWINGRKPANWNNRLV